MSDTTVVPSGTDPSAAEKDAANKAAAEAAAAKATADPDLVRMTPAQFKARQDEAAKAGEKRAAEQFAASLGVDLDAAKKLIADAKARDDAQKSEVQKLTEQLSAERARLAQFDAYKGAVEGRATVEYAALDDVQKKAVDDLAGTDPAARLRTIDALRPTWVAAQRQIEEARATAAATAEAAQKAKAEEAAKATAAAKIPAPATTLPTVTPPPPTAPGQPTNHLAVYRDLQTRNPALAANYYNAHGAAIRAAQKQATG